MTTKGLVGLMIVAFSFVAVATCEYEERMAEERAVQENIERHKPANNLYNYEYRSPKAMVKG